MQSLLIVHVKGERHTDLDKYPDEYLENNHIDSPYKIEILECQKCTFLNTRHIPYPYTHGFNVELGVPIKSNCNICMYDTSQKLVGLYKTEAEN